MQDQKWKPKDGQKYSFLMNFSVLKLNNFIQKVLFFFRFSLENEEQASSALSTSIQTKIYREIVDFENHLDNVALDFWNSFVNDKIKSITDWIRCY